jgi:hypothetical protein
LRQRCGIARLHVAKCNLNISLQRHWWIGLLPTMRRIAMQAGPRRS